MDYPGRVIKQGEQDAALVKALKRQLNQALALQAGDEGLQPLDETNPNFGPNMKQAVRLFQARHVDAQGRPLKADGEIGAITWSVLFRQQAAPGPQLSRDALLARVLQIAGAECDRGVREIPPNSNRGPDVEKYLASTGLGGGFPWCCAFVYWCFEQAAQALQRGNPMLRTAGCLAHWSGAQASGARRILRQQALADPGLIQPGMIFIMDFGGGAGHTGLIERVGGGLIETIEGNTDASKTREGGGVYRLTRKLLDINKGFIDYGGL